jgi:3-oxoadipate enol-lactonase
MKVTSNGISFNCEIDGPEGAPWITFSNSLCTNVTMWDDQVAALKDDFRLLRYDKRGHGGTDAPEGPYSFDMLVADIVGLWDALDIEKSHFVGLSMGGMSAFGLALDHADRLDGVVISNARADAPAAFRDAWDQRVAFVEENGMGALAEPTVERWCSESFHSSGSPKLDKMRAMVSATPPTGFIGCARAIQGLDYHRRIREIEGVRALFIAGAEDMATPADNMRVMHADFAGAEFVELSPAGHLSNMEQPEAYNETLRNFLG